MLNIGDWVCTKDGKYIKIISDRMKDLPFKKIVRKIEDKNELKFAIRKGLINADLDGHDILDKRMYIFVPYNISEIQKGIQAGHAVEQYAYKYNGDLEYVDYVSNHKTWIILNGGTTNSNRNFDGLSEGSLNNIFDSLVENKIKFAYFNEPDLNNALTAVCFLTDERVFNWTDYPLFEDLNKDAYTIKGLDINGNPSIINWNYISEEKYENLIGGSKNVFLKKLIKDKKLA